MTQPRCQLYLVLTLLLSYYT